MSGASERMSEEEFERHAAVMRATLTRTCDCEICMAVIALDAEARRARAAERRLDLFYREANGQRNNAEKDVIALRADLAREKERADYHANALRDLAQAVALKLNPIGCDGATVYEKVCKAVARIERFRFLVYHIKVECPDGYENRCDECAEVRAIVREEAAKS